MAPGTLQGKCLLASTASLSEPDPSPPPHLSHLKHTTLSFSFRSPLPDTLPMSPYLSHSTSPPVRECACLFPQGTCPRVLTISSPGISTPRCLTGALQVSPPALQTRPMSVSPTLGLHAWKLLAHGGGCSGSVGQMEDNVDSTREFHQNSREGKEAGRGVHPDPRAFSTRGGPTRGRKQGSGH